MSDITDQEVLDALAARPHERDIVNAYRRGYEDCEAKNLILETDRIWLTRDEAKRIRNALTWEEFNEVTALLDERIGDTDGI